MRPERGGVDLAEAIRLTRDSESMHESRILQGGLLFPGPLDSQGFSNTGRNLFLPDFRGRTTRHNRLSAYP